ncbi:MAG: ATP-binding cassette domain-containing protein [Candidatus Cloacimonetes bacterium]|nr:ATP-binding cassette domain-containing protein [Candidatus Cloacimonadota bacterium]
MIKKGNQDITKVSSTHRKKIIEMIARFYIILLKSDVEINPFEINMFYSLLENLFTDENISWEEQISQLSDAQLDMDEVTSYLNRNLITLDKIRLLLSLMILANADNEFTVAEVTKILDIAKKFNVDTDNFLELMEAIEKDSQELVSIGGFRYIGHTSRAIFRDYLLIGTGESSHIRFQDKKLAANELLMMVIDDYIFIGTSNNSTSYLNGKLLLPNRLYFFPSGGVLMVGNLQFNYRHLQKIFRTRKIYDVIDFKKRDYDFKLINDHNSYSIIVYSGTVFRNGRELPINREIHLKFDDTLQIKGYQPFTMLNVIEERENIGTEVLYPEKLFVNLHNNYLTATQEETPHSVVTMGVENNEIFIETVKKGWELFLNNQPVTEKTKYHLNRDILTLSKTEYSQKDSKERSLLMFRWQQGLFREQFIINNYFDIVVIPFEIEQIRAIDIKHYFKDGTLALDGISLTAQKGEIIAIMGKSGSGKSTLLKSISADIVPRYGRVLINNDDLYDNLYFYAQHIGYVPQEDLLFPNLTVYENLFYRGKLILPGILKDILDRKVIGILTQMNLVHRRNTKVGEINESLLSGGERKRLNIALELLFEPTLIICDEPTTGLSSTDSEQIVDILKNYSDQGKIVIITIHQPNPNIFEKINKVLVMDMGGKPVYFGDCDEVFSYFDHEVEQIEYRREEIEKKRNQRMPDFFQDIIDYPQYNESNEKIYEQIDQTLIPRRKFSPNYWRDKYKRKQLFELISFETEQKKNIKTKKEISRKKMPLTGHLSQFMTYLKRNVLMKLRNRTNLFITFAEAPLLGIIIAFILRISLEGEGYNYHHNANIAVYLFVSLIVFIFLGLSNSIEEIMGERKTIQREKVLNLKLSYFLTSKIIALAIFTLVQVILYYLVSSVILQLPGLIFINIVYFFFAGLIGYSLGLLISSFINNRKAIINVLPLILIPQIIFGGAIILYENMNPQLTVRKSSTIPEVVQFIPSRWLFEGLVTAQSRLNSYNYNIQRQDRKRLTLVEKIRNNKINDEEYIRSLDDLSRKKAEIARKYPKEQHTNYNIELIVNFMDGRFLNSGKNVFLSSWKKVGEQRFVTYYFNLLILFFYTIVINFATLVKLKYFFKER